MISHIKENVIFLTETMYYKRDLKGVMDGNGVPLLKRKPCPVVSILDLAKVKYEKNDSRLIDMAKFHLIELKKAA